MGNAAPVLKDISITSNEILSKSNENNDLNRNSITITTNDDLVDAKSNNDGVNDNVLIPSSNNNNIIAKIPSTTTNILSSSSNIGKHIDKKSYKETLLYKNNHTIHNINNNNNNYHHHHHHHHHHHPHSDNDIDHYLKQLLLFDNNNSSKVEKRNALDKLVELAAYNDDNKRIIVNDGGIPILIDIIKQLSCQHQQQFHQLHHYQQQSHQQRDHVKDNKLYVTPYIITHHDEYLRVGAIVLLGSLASVAEYRLIIQQSADLWSSLLQLLRDGSSSCSSSIVQEMISICKLINILSLCNSYNGNYNNDHHKSGNNNHNHHHHHDNIILYIESIIPLVIHLLDNHKYFITTIDKIIIIDILYNLLLSYHRISIIICQCNGIKIILQLLKIIKDDNNDNSDNTGNNDDTNINLFLSILTFVNQMMRIIIYNYPHFCLYFNIYFDNKYLYHLKTILQKNNDNNNDIIYLNKDEKEKEGNDNNNDDDNVRSRNEFQSSNNNNNTDTTTTTTSKANDSHATTVNTARYSTVMIMMNKQVIICINLLCYNHKLRDIILKLDYLKLLINLLHSYYNHHLKELNKHYHNNSFITTPTIPILLNTKAITNTIITTTKNRLLLSSSSSSSSSSTTSTTTTMNITNASSTMILCILEALSNMIHDQDSFKIIIEYNIINILYDILYHNHQFHCKEIKNNNHNINRYTNNHLHKDDDDNNKHKHHHHQTDFLYHHNSRLLVVTILQKWLYYDNKYIIITLGGGIDTLITFKESLVIKDNNYENNRNDNDNNNHDDDEHGDDHDDSDINDIITDIIKQAMIKKQKQIDREIDNLMSPSKQSTSIISSSGAEVAVAVPSSLTSQSINPYLSSSSTSSSSSTTTTTTTNSIINKMINEEFYDDRDWLQDLSFVKTRSIK